MLIRYMRLAIAMILALSACAGPAGAGVELLRTPDGGAYPRAVVDGAGVLHLIYFKGDPQRGDIYYVRWADPARGFSKPLRVNSQDGTAMIVGTVRGPQLAIGKANRLHVAWMGSPAAMFYARMDDAGTTFQAQRNLVTEHPGLDGGGTLAADPLGHVYVVWHAPQSVGQTDEANRRVWIVRSDDSGKTFSPETDGGSAHSGVCACCNLGAWAQEGSIHVLYRCATEKVHRDMHLLTFDDQLKCIADRTVAETRVGKCIMSTASFARGVGAFESNGQVHWMRLATDADPIAAPGDAPNRKHPSIAVNPHGDVLLAWTQGSSWNKGGRLAWQMFDREGKPRGAPGRGDELPPFSLPAALARPDGSFVIVY